MSTVFKVTQLGDQLQLSGHLDEHADLAPLASLRGSAKFSFKDLARINSVGITHWCELMETLQKAGTAVTYVECPVSIVKQLNSVPEFRGHARIESFYASFFCNNCDDSETHLLESQDTEGHVCSKCGGPMRFDGIPQQYFSFLASRS